MRHVSLALSVAVLIAAFAARAGDGHLDYEHQETWKAAHDIAQSPIDIVTRNASEARDDEPLSLEFRHTRGPIDEVRDNGHAVEVETHATRARIRGRSFTLTQFHFHASSEHTIDGRHHPLEGHFVFKAQDGRLAVVAVMYDVGAANAVAQSLLDELDGRKPHHSQTLDIAALMPRRKAYYHYLGSLTTPPLTENVEWYVLSEPVPLSRPQVDALLAHYRHNNRNIQPLNGRPVVHYPG